MHVQTPALVAGKLRSWIDAQPAGAREVAGRLEGKIALIVGAGCVGPGWGNGRAACVLFAQEGAKIFAVDREHGADGGDRCAGRRRPAARS